MLDPVSDLIRDRNGHQDEEVSVGVFVELGFRFGHEIPEPSSEDG
jgi:hypothetical protein